MTRLALFVLAAFFEIAGCFAFWAWLKHGRLPAMAVLGIASLAVFAFCLAQVSAAYAGRAFAAYGGIYIAASLLWMWLVEGGRPDRWDLAGGAVSILGAMIIVFGRRAA